MQKYKLIIIPIFFFLIICTKKSPYPINVKIVNGVNVIMNPDYPRDARVDLQLEEELTIGVEEGDDNYIFDFPSEIRVGDNGNIYISDNNQIKCYNRNGQYLRTIGRKGQGPGEFLGSRFALSQDGKIYVMDKINARITIFDTNGVYFKSFNVSNLNTNWHHIYSDQYNNIYFSREFRDEEKYVMSIHRYNAIGQESLNYGKFLADQIVMIKQGNSFMPIRTSAAPTTVWIVSKTGKLYAGFSKQFLISVYDEQGKLLFKFGRKYKPIADKLGWLSGSKEYLPAFFRNWLIDDNQNLWIELFNPENRDQIIYDIFSADGIYLKQVYVDYRIEALKSGKVFCIVKTDNEFFVVKRFQIIENQRK